MVKLIKHNWAQPLPGLLALCKSMRDALCRLHQEGSKTKNRAVEKASKLTNKSLSGAAAPSTPASVLGAGLPPCTSVGLCKLIYQVFLEGEAPSNTPKKEAPNLCAKKGHFNFAGKRDILTLC